jgi:hypothetical protein
MASESIVKNMSLLPEYQENFLKDLLANIYQVDEETGEITGIAASSPLYGKPVLDESGQQMYVGADGTYVSDPSLAATDQYGAPIFATEGGVAVPDIIGFTDAQIDAIRRMTGYTDPETGEVIYESALEAYKPYVDLAEDAFTSGTDLLDASTALYDPQGQIVYDTVTDPVTGETSQVARTDAEGNVVRKGGYKDYYDPFVEDVIDASALDIQEALEREKNTLGAKAGSYGAFGRRRDLIEGQTIGEALSEESKMAAKLRSAAFEGAMKQSQSAFENQQKRGLDAATTFQGLGTAFGALGEATQGLGFEDINALYNVGLLEQNQLQKEYDVQRAAQLEEAYEPFARFSYMRDILSGMPASSTALAAAATPQASPLGAAVNYTGQLGGGDSIFGLGSLKNVSGT